MKRKEKETSVAALKDLIAGSQSVVVTDFKGLKVDEMSGLRRKLREADADYHVAKNTLIRRAIQDTEAECIGDLLVGNSALSTTGRDPASLAKALVEFAKSNDKLVIKGGALGGKPLNAAQIKAIADLPPREVLLAMAFGALAAVPTGFVRVLAAVPQKLLYALSAIRDQKESAA